MRLINTGTLDFEEFYGDRIPNYAILSHTWEEGEVTFQDWQDRKAASRKAGYVKIQGACRQACKDGLDYVWVDTNCIDKSSSAELTEAINSMFAWYRDAVVCYVYLVDVPHLIGIGILEISTNRLRQSRWFTRGWTLQELLAPSHVVFFASDWSRLGERISGFANAIAEITGIDHRYMTRESCIEAPIATKMYWLSRRATTRIEDMAYCMLGLFDINMPLLYGEGAKAFTRLQEEIIKVSNDHTIFCWTWTDSVPSTWTSLLAPSPETFKYSRSFVQSSSITGNVSTYAMTNAGLSISLPMIRTSSFCFVVLNVRERNKQHRACVPINGLGNMLSVDSADDQLVQRISFPTTTVNLPYQWATPKEQMYVRIRPDPWQDSPFLPKFTAKFGILITICVGRLYGSDFGRSLYTFPPNLHDYHRSIFLLNYKIVDSVYGGFVHFIPSDKSAKTEVVVFFAIKVVPNLRTQWFCHILDEFSGTHGSNEPWDLLESFGKQVASSDCDQLIHEPKSIEATALITKTDEQSSLVFRVARISFGSGSDLHSGDYFDDVMEMEDITLDIDDDPFPLGVANWISEPEQPPLQECYASDSASSRQSY